MSEKGRKAMEKRKREREERKKGGKGAAHSCSLVLIIHKSVAASRPIKDTRAFIGRTSRGKRAFATERRWFSRVSLSFVLSLSLDPKRSADTRVRCCILWLLELAWRPERERKARLRFEKKWSLGMYGESARVNKCMHKVSLKCCLLYVEWKSNF